MTVPRVATASTVAVVAGETTVAAAGGLSLPRLPSPPAAVPSAVSAAASPSVPAVPPTPTSRRVSYFRYAAADHLAAGVTAGLVSTLCLHPFDLIKTRLQVSGFTPTAATAATVAATPSATLASSAHVGLSGTALAGGPGSARIYRSSLHAARSLVTHEGWASLYKGLTPNLVGNTLAWGLYFFAYDIVKREFNERPPMAFVRLVSTPSALPDADPSSSHRPRRPLNALEHILAASFTGVCVSAMTNPLWVVKTRMFLDHTDARDARAQAPYRGLVDALRGIFRTEGIAGLYRGFVPGLFGVSHGAVQFMSYEELKKWRLAYKRKSAGASSLDTAGVSWTTPETVAMSVAAKSFATCSTYPYQVVRSRMQASSQAVTLRSVVLATWRAEGVSGFYRGLWVNLVKVMPAACTVFVVYEQMSGLMKRHATHVHSG